MDESLDPETFAESLVPVASFADLASTPLGTPAILLAAPSDELLAAVAERLPGLRHLVTDGNNGAITDAGLAHLATFSALESLDLEWSAVSDAGLPAIAAVATLGWVDLGGATAITPAGLAELRCLRPDLEVEAHGL